MKYIFTIPALILAVYLLINLVVPVTFKGDTTFIANAALWAAVIAATIIICKLTQTHIWQTDKTLIQLATIIAIFQVFLTIFMAFFMGFGKNANVWTPSTLTIYFPYLLVPFLAIELSRAYLAQSTSKNKSTLQILLISLFLTLISMTIPRYLDLTTPLAISEFLIKTFIPTLAINLLATYFAFLGRLTANLTYMAIPAFFAWFSPILPNPPWAVQSMTSVIATTVGFLLMDQTTKPLPTKHIHRILKKQKSQIPYWTAIALIGLIAVWSSTGLLGFTPTIIVSGSMTPTLNPGDITIIISVPPATIKVDDIIQYRTTAEPIVHRVIDEYEAGGSIWFITQGDANNAPDNPVNERQITGKAIFTIPKLGWISIYLKTAITTAASFLQNNIIASCATIGLILTYSAFRIHKYKNQPLNKLKRKFRR
jgi:signal peptidase I